MELKKIKFAEEKLREQASKYFVSAGGFDPSKEKHRRMLEMAKKVREECFYGNTVNAHVRVLEPNAFRSGKIVVDGNIIDGNCFQIIDEDNIVKIYVYILTVGHIEYERYDGISNQLHADMWGTAYVDTGRDFLEEWIREQVESEYPEIHEQKIFVSQELSPGFYGIPVPSSVPIKMITEADELGIDVKENGIMLPVKTCSGIHLVVKDKSQLPLQTCINCIGSEKGCMFCKKREKNMEVQS